MLILTSQLKGQNENENRNNGILQDHAQYSTQARAGKQAGGMGK
jgi:hypothetical protein